MSTTIVDSHCHIHSQETLGQFAEKLNNLSAGQHWLVCVVELRQSQWFGEIGRSDLLEIAQIDSVSLSVYRETSSCLLIKGEQVNTSEKLEVIVIGCEDVVPEGLPVQEYITRYSDDYLVVLPWGAGKWTGRRGAIVRSLVKDRAPIALGDNGGRPVWWKSDLLESDSAFGLPVLRGADPLPVSSYSDRVLAYADLEQRVFRSASEWINYVKSGERCAKPYGALRSTVGFLKDQIELRLR